MKGTPLIFGIVYSALFLSVFLCHYEAEQIRYDFLETTINESVKIASKKSIDYSSRTSRTKARLDESKFKMEFEQAFKEANNTYVSNPKINYQFFNDANNNTISVHVKLTDKENRFYNKTCAMDLNNREY